MPLNKSYTGAFLILGLLVGLTAFRDDGPATDFLEEDLLSRLRVIERGCSEYLEDIGDTMNTLRKLIPAE